MHTSLLRFMLPAFALLAIAVPSASAAPLAGTGENIVPIARLPIGHPNEVELAGDWAFVSNDGSYTEKGGGLTIVNIADPTHPYIQGEWVCDAGWGDVDISPDATIAVLTNAHNGECLGKDEDTDKTWAAIIDISDKSHPKLLSRIADDDEIEYVHTSTLDQGGKRLYLNPQAWAGYPQGQNPHIPIYDISNPSKPVRKGFVESEGVGLAHDTYIDHRPDGKSLLYAASIHTSDVFDVTDPFAATMLQRTIAPGEYTISHDVQPSWDRKVIIVDDEGAAGGQLDEAVSACGKEGPADSGSVHFFEANPDGTFANEGAVELGSFNAPSNVDTGACVAHVFWQAPSENRLTQAYYRTGAFAVDFSDPTAPALLGDFHAEGGGNYWSNKPHNGYMYATNQDTDGESDGSLDILRYTGEGGKRWPATAGPAEVQRSARQGVPYVPLKTAAPVAEPAPQGEVLPQGPIASRSIGRIRFTARLARVPGRAGKRSVVKFTFRTAKGKRVGSVRVRRAAGKRATVKIFGGAVTGRYTWVATVGKKRIGKGKLTVGKARMTLAPNLTLSVGAK